MGLLDIDNRTKKNRVVGVTSISDLGLGLRAVEDLVEIAGSFIDFVKFSVGTAYVTNKLEEKVKLYAENKIPVYFGGSLFENFAVINKENEYKRWLQKLDISHVEISNGMDLLSEERKLDCVTDFQKDFCVFSEVGMKDAKKNDIPSSRWIKMINDSLSAGASYVVAEGRQSGNSGIYNDSGDVKEGLILEIVEKCAVNKIVFEAPRERQQIYFINTLGCNVNIGNVLPESALMLETQRMGLRHDTYDTLKGAN